LPGSTRFAYAEGCRCCPEQLILRTPKAVGMARINCRSALARECDFAATHLSSGSPRSPASRLLQIRVRGTLPVLPESTDLAYAEGCRCCPDQRISRARKVAGVARINGFRVRGRLRMLPGSTDFGYAKGCRCCPDQRISRTPKAVGMARINCRSALAREGDFDAAHLSLSHRYLAIGSRPLALMAGAAADELRKSRNCLACSGCLLWVTTPAEYRVICCA
jgi:hypothetical protein